MKARLAKICPLLPFAIYGFLLIIYIFLCLFSSEESTSFFSIAEGFFILCGLFGWIPSLISSVLGIIFSALSLKERRAKIFLILSSVNAVIGALWGWLALVFVLGYENVYML